MGRWVLLSILGLATTKPLFVLALVWPATGVYRVRMGVILPSTTQTLSAPAMRSVRLIARLCVSQTRVHLLRASSFAPMLPWTRHHHNPCAHGTCIRQAAARNSPLSAALRGAASTSRQACCAMKPFQGASQTSSPSLQAEI